MERVDLHSFRIDPEGIYIHWPCGNVHMTWDWLEEIVDPLARLRAKQKSARFNRRYGAAIRALRNETGLRQREIPGLDERHVRRIELGRQRLTLGAAAKLAQAHGLSVGDYLGELARRS